MELRWILVVILVSWLMLPLLLLALLGARLLQFITHGEVYDTVTHVKLTIHAWLTFYYNVFMCFHYILLLCDWLIGPLAFLSSYKILETSLYDWIMCFIMIQVMFSLSFMVTLLIKGEIQSIPLYYIDNEHLYLQEVVREINDCIVAVMLLEFLCLGDTIFKENKILGMHTWKWIEVLICVLFVHNIISLTIHTIVMLLKKYVGDLEESNNITDFVLLPVKLVVYWTNGMKDNIIFVLSSLVLLLTWVIHIGGCLENTPKAKRILDFGFWVFVSFLICAFFWLIKTYVILSWEYRSVYTRLGSKILEGRKQLYFLSRIGGPNYDILKLWDTRKPYKSHIPHNKLLVKLYDIYQSDYSEKADPRANGKKLSRRRMERVKEYLLMDGTASSTIYNIQQMALLFLTAKDKLTDEASISNIHPDNRRRYDETVEEEQRYVEKLIGNDDWNLFVQELQLVGLSENPSFAELETWMKTARDNCFFLANTLSSSKEVVDCLNKITSSFIIIGTLVMWMIFTELATTPVIVSITGALGFATIASQESCKTIVHGILFAYVMHPFNVGDLCFIENKLIEVRTIGLWKTTFLIIGTHEELTYANSELRNKSIINHKTDFDWNDYVEFDVSSLTQEKIELLMQDIQRYVEDEENGFTPNYNRVEISTEADNIKITVNFRHRVSNAKIKNYFECLKEKGKLRSKFLLYGRSLVKAHPKKTK